MKTQRKRSQTRIRITPLNLTCPFCETKTDPDYSDVESWGKYLTDRDKIMQRARTGLCAKHQRRLSIAIKRARHLMMSPQEASLQ